MEARCNFRLGNRERATGLRWAGRVGEGRCFGDTWWGCPEWVEWSGCLPVGPRYVRRKEKRVINGDEEVLVGM